MDIKDEQKKWLKEGLVSKVLDIVPAKIFWKNKEGVYLGCNDFFAKSVKEEGSDSVVGKTDYDLPVKKEDSDSFRRDDIEVMNSGKAKLDIEEKQTLDDGKVVYLLTSKIPFYGENDDLLGIIGLYHDITELKSSQRKSEAASKAKSEFIANMSHDLRTPMTGVMGMLQEIRNVAKDIEKEPSKAIEYAADIGEQAKIGEDSANQLLELFNDTIEHIKLASGKIDAKIINFSMDRCLSDMIEMQQSVAKKKSLGLNKILSPDLPSYFLGARGTLGRILVNLVSNALKFTKEGSVTIYADLISDGPTEVGDEVMVRISVVDTGIGIPEDKYEEIFEHYSRLNPSYEGQFKGNGLGLFAVDSYVKSMKGTITVESEVGKGSKFIVEIPLKVSDQSDKEEKLEPIPPLPDENKIDSSEKIAEQGNGNQKEKPAWQPVSEEPEEVVARVLVVEDNFAAAMAIKRALKRLGCESDHAKSGEESVDFARKSTYDIIFMDIGLPGISGLEAAKQIRDFASVPIIAVTGHVDKAGDCINAGMQELLAKPATPSSLEAMLKRHVHSKNDEIQKLNDSQTIIDFACSLRMNDNDEEVTREVLDFVYEGLIESEKIIDAAYIQKNIRRLRDEIHKVKGGVCYLRLPQLERALNDFHLTLKEDPINPEDMDKEYQNLKRAIKNFKEAYEKGGYQKPSASV